MDFRVQTENKTNHTMNMKQKLSLALFALLATAGTWAKDISVGISTGTFYRDGSSALTPSGSNQFASKWVSTDAIGLTLTCSGNNMIINTGYGTSTGLNLHGNNLTYTLEAKNCNITGYSITGYAANGSSSINGTTVGTTADAATTVTQTGLTGSTATFVIAGTADPWMYITDFVVSVEEPDKTIQVTYEVWLDGTATGDTFTETVLPGSSIAVPSAITGSYNSVAYDITTEGTIGEEDTTIRVNVNAKANLVKGLADLRNDKAYSIVCERGSFTTVDGSLANTVKSGSYAVTQFAVISYEDRFFLWSVADGKFVACDGATLGEQPVAVTLTEVSNSVYKFQGNGKTLNATAGFTTGAGFDSWSTTDAGNSCAIFEVADYDATEVLEALEIYFNAKLLNLAVSVTGTTEAENTRAGKVTLTLADESVSKFLNADTETLTDLQYLDATFTATATSYRGYEFTGFSIDGADLGTSIELGELSDVASGATLTANFKASTGGGINLWYDYSDDMQAAYRLPAILRTQSGRIVAFADYRPGKQDVGIAACSIECRYSDDGGTTWSAPLTVAEGKWRENAENSVEWSYGDAAVVADQTPGNSGQDVLMICVGGNCRWSNSTYKADMSQIQQCCVRWRSSDGGATWGTYENLMPQLMQAFVDAGLRAEDGSDGIVRAFFTSGKITQSVRKAAGAAYNRLYSAVVVNGGNVVVYSDDFGQTWTVLGGQIANNGDEAHVVELPDGAILLVGRGNSSRWVNVFNYTDFDAAAGAWDATGQWNNAVATGCNGDVEVVEAYDSYGERSTVVLQTAPMYGNQRRDIQYYFIGLPKSEGFHVTDFSTVGGASWTQGMNVTHNWSAYSALLPNADGSFDILFEESAAGETLTPSGYSIVYQQAHALKDITVGQFFMDKDEALAEGVRTPRQGHFYRFRGSASGAYLTAGSGTLRTSDALDASTIWYWGAEGLVSYSTGLCLDCSAKALAAAGTACAASVSDNENFEGTYVIRSNGYYCYSATAGGAIDRGSALSTAQGYAWEVEDVTSLPVTVSALGLATLYSPVALTVPEGVKVYSAQKNEADGIIHFDEVEGVKAGTGVLLEAAAGTYSLPIADSGADYESDLVGSVLSRSASGIDAKVYTLQSGPSFRLFSGTTLTGFRSHIETEQDASIKAFNFDLSDATAIGEIYNVQKDNVLFNLAGQRLGRMQKGVNIVNGKKILR